MTYRFLLNGLLVLGALVALGVLARVAGLDELLGTAWIDAEVRGQGWRGEALFIAVGTLATAAGFPRQVVAFMGGYAFGFVAGSALGLLAAIAGCVLTYQLARLLRGPLLAGRHSERARRIGEFVHGHTFSMTLLIRLLPVGSNVLTNVAAGIAHVRALPFFAGSALGYLPQTLIFALVGSGIHLDPELRIGVGVALFVLSGVIGLHLYRRLRRSRRLDASVENALAGRETVH
jgi:uncharacterized membrane protein YdjX (TVP38/TMEM64 family)